MDVTELENLSNYDTSGIETKLDTLIGNQSAFYTQTYEYQKGTLILLLLVVAILGILVGIGLGSIFKGK